MKRILLLSCASLLSIAAVAPSTSSDARAWSAHWNGATVSTDDPAPIECPMCGGNAELHKKRLKALAGFQATLMLEILVAR